MIKLCDKQSSLLLDQRPLHTVHTYRVTEFNMKQGVKYSNVIYKFIIVCDMDNFSFQLLCKLYSYHCL